MSARVALVGTQPETAVEDTARLLRLLWPGEGLAGAGVDLLLAGRGDRPGRAVSPWLLAGALAGLQERLPSGQSPRVFDHWRGGAGQAPAAPAAAVLARSGLSLSGPPALPRPSSLPPGPRPRLVGLVPLGSPSPGGLEGACAAIARACGERDPGAAGLDEALARLAAGHGRTAWLLDMAVVAPAEGSGPWWPALHGLLLAGDDPVAVDRAAADLLGLDERALPLLEALRRLGRRPASRRELEWVGDDPARYRREGRALPRGRQRRWPWHPLLERRAMALYRRCPWGQLEAALTEGSPP